MLRFVVGLVKTACAPLLRSLIHALPKPSRRRHALVNRGSICREIPTAHSLKIECRTAEVMARFLRRELVRVRGVQRRLVL